MKTPLIYLVHRIPYPPDKGDKIRSFHILRHLAESYEIYLGAFVDDQEDWQYANELKPYCKKTYLEKLNPGYAKIKSLSGLVKGTAMTVPYYYSNTMRDWVNSILNKYHVKQAVVFSAAMAQYLSGNKFNGMHRLIDFVDVDSDKWAQYAESKTWPMSFIYARESRQLLAYERKIAKEYTESYFVSHKESQHFQTLAPECKNKINFFNNGVDSEYFSPVQQLVNPFSDNRKILTFTGAMDYWANVDAVVWFANEILPKISAKNKNVCFYIVGSKPTPQVKALASRENIIVTGKVPDIRPYLKYTDVSVAPLRIARGIQNKVLEAMAMSCSIVTTPAAAEGITTNNDFVVADTADEFAHCCLNLLDTPDETMRNRARQSIIEHYLWSKNLDTLVNGLMAT